MDERGDDHGEARAPEPEPDDAGDAARRAARERHVRAARRFFEAVPPYRAQFERDGTVSLHLKEYRYWPDRAPADATGWKPISIHQSLEQAERRLRHITSPHIYYDERGQLARAPEPDEEERAVPENPWRP